MDSFRRKAATARMCFVHISAVERAGFASVVEDAAVDYELETDRRSGKASAVNLKIGKARVIHDSCCISHQVEDYGMVDGRNAQVLPQASAAWWAEREATDRQMDALLAEPVPESPMERNVRRMRFAALIERRNAA